VPLVVAEIGTLESVLDPERGVVLTVSLHLQMESALALPVGGVPFSAVKRESRHSAAAESASHAGAGTSI
jgi:hypothetical protein